MQIEKLPSGSYRVRQQYNKKLYGVVIDHKPTQKEAMEILSELMKDDVVDPSSFSSAAERYIKLKANILSPRTIREYELLPKDKER